MGPFKSEILRTIANPPNPQLEKALHDLWAGLQRWQIWGNLAWQDTRRQYIRSLIGPFWITISMGMMVVGLGLLYGFLLKIPPHDYIPYLAIGFITWGLIASLINDGCKAFISGEGLIKQLPIPLSVHVYRVVYQSFIVFSHNIWIYFIAALVFMAWPGTTALWAIPGLIVLCLNGVWVGLLFGLICTRFRDIPQIIASIVQISFFMTPVIWKADQLTDRAVVVNWNPFYYMLEVVRAPLLGSVPSIKVWVVVMSITVIGWLLALFFFMRFRWRIAYWV